jgi:hypothetical protein
VEAFEVRAAVPGPRPVLEVAAERLRLTVGDALPPAIEVTSAPGGAELWITWPAEHATDPLAAARRPLGSLPALLASAGVDARDAVRVTAIRAAVLGREGGGGVE